LQVLEQEEMTKQAGGHDQIAGIWRTNSNLALAKTTLLNKKKRTNRVKRTEKGITECNTY